jgi:hypothetical protein
MSSIAHRQRRRRRGPILLILIPLVTLGLLAVLWVVADGVARDLTEKGISDGIEQQLPPTVEGSVVTKIGEGSVLAQFLKGTIDEISLDSDPLAVSGAPAAVHVDLRGVPTEYQTKPTQSAAGTLRFTDAAAGQLLAQQGVKGTISFGAGVVNYSDTTQVLGQDIPFTVELQPDLAGGVLSFTPKGGTVTVLGTDFDASRLIELVAPEGLSICVAQYLPSALQLNRLQISESEAVVGFSAHDITFSPATMQSTGSCG